MYHLNVCQKLKNLNTPEGNFAADLNLKRAEVGLKKYGVGLDRKDVSEKEWLIHALEEALDLANYLEVVICQSHNKFVPILVTLQEQIIVAAVEIVSSINHLEIIIKE